MSDKTKTLFVRLFIISYFLDSYYWFQVSTYFATTFTLACGFLIIVSTTLLITNHRNLTLDRPQIILLIFVFYQILNSLLHGMSNITSPLLSVFLFASFFYTRRNESQETTNYNINLFSNITNVLAIYGIYQFFARMLNLPFGDPIIEGHMVEGFNWTNIVYSIGRNVSRSNSVFLEPSFFSQTAAINVLILTVKIIENRHTWKTWLMVIMNLIGMAVSLSGTGILILIFGSLAILLYERRIKELKRIAILSLIVTIVAFLILMFAGRTDFVSKMITMFIDRAGEISGKRGVNVSGYLRFSYSIPIILKVWLESPFNFLFGAGPGSARYYNAAYHAVLDNSGYYKVATELGFIGIMIYVWFLLSVVKKSRKHPNRYVWVIAVSVVIMIACNSGIMQNYVWILLCLINISAPYSGSLDYS